MKTKVIVTALFIAFLFSNCSIDKRLYRPGFHIEWRNNSSNNNQNPTSQNSDINGNKEINLVATNSQELELEKSIDNYELETILKEDQEADSNPIESSRIIINDSCDLIFCNNGDEIDAKVIEIGLSEIKYKKCDNPNGPTISIRKSEVLMIKYPNGTKDIIKSTSSGNSSSNKINDGPSLNPLALTSMILGILSLLLLFVVTVYMIPAGIAAIILGVVAIKQIKENPDNFTSTSSKMANAGIICAIVGLGILFLLGSFL